MVVKSYQPKKLRYDDTNQLKAVLSFEKYRLRWSQRIYLAFKRVMDIVLGLLAILLLLPLFMVFMIWIPRDSDGPALFLQSRVGLHGRVFKIYKFRTMYTTAPSGQATRFVKNAESYVTKLGSILRRTSIDELPQLINVVKGDMSLVGPRPLIKNEADMDYLRRVNGIYQLRPGITGLAQVSGRDNVEIDQKIAYDREYLRSVGLWTDLKILVKTVLVVFNHDGVAF